MAKKQFHRHYATKGPQLFWIIFAYLILGWFFPVLGWAALICMIGPVLTSVWKGRFWCGNVCPRGNMYDRLLSKYYSDVFCLGRLGRNGLCVLENHLVDYDCRNNPVLHLCPSHMVQFLSDGFIVIMGGS